MDDEDENGQTSCLLKSINEFVHADLPISTRVTGLHNFLQSSEVKKYIIKIIPKSTHMTSKRNQFI